MATGEQVGHTAVETRPAAKEPAASTPASGAVVMDSGRLSVARSIKPAPPVVPFNSVHLARLDEAITLATRATGLDFSVYLGDLGTDTRAGAERLHASLGPQVANNAVVVAVSPGQRTVEIVTGRESYRRVPDRTCNLAVMTMVASFKEGDLIGGLVSAVRMLADQAGPPPKTEHPRY